MVMRLRRWPRTGVFAFLVAAAQGLWVPEAATNMRLFISLWVGTAAVCVIVIAIETIRRSRRAHGGLATAMLQSALEQFVPAIVAGGLLTVALLEVARTDPVDDSGAVARCVQPRACLVRAAFCRARCSGSALWYLACGLACLALAAPTHAVSAWAMGIPYGVGSSWWPGILQFRGQLEPSR